MGEEETGMKTAFLQKAHVFAKLERRCSARNRLACNKEECVFQLVFTPFQCLQRNEDEKDQTIKRLQPTEMRMARRPTLFSRHRHMWKLHA